MTFTRPKVGTDDRTMDLRVFLSNFKYAMLNRKCSTICMCKVFPELLSGAANGWFNELPRQSISSFKDLAVAFFNRFY